MLRKVEKKSPENRGKIAVLGAGRPQSKDCGRPAPTTVIFV